MARLDVRSRLEWWKSRRHVSGVIILTLFAAFIAMAAWAGPRQSRYDNTDFVEPHHFSLTSEQPKSLHELSWWSEDLAEQLYTPLATELGPGDAVPMYVVSDNGDGQVQWTQKLSNSPEIAELRKHDSGAESRPVTTMRWVTNTARLLSIFTFIIIVVADPPRRGNRWYWFWMMGIPLGLGVAWFAWTEKIRDPEQQKYRKHGTDGFFTLIGLYIAVQVGFGLLGGL
ncbi:hypothetical protein VV02_23790 [Luteipulveratus mongoliensis]|uniref:Uncharacterized protein n=2 Tax=Luteipulveratus mongoliensis TaxID=571913 RepID=A0A0K1JNJ9_9MICO|nr:hypothetical protein VV02_23790 [Luteipulveratus mongoliensis]